MKGKKKKATKSIGKLEKYALSYKKAQQRARDFVESMPKNFVLSEDMMKRIYSEAPERLTKKKADEMKRIISKPFLKRNATMTVSQWEKQITYTDIDPDGNKITRTVPVSSMPKAGQLDIPVKTEISYATYENAKQHQTKNSTQLASALNSMISYQRNNFKTVEGPVTNKLWILAKDLAGGIPTTSNEYFSLRPFMKDGKRTTYKYNPNDPTESMKDFWQAVHFKKIPGWAMKTVEQIAMNPQTNPELYEEFRKSASLRSLATNMKKLTQQTSQQTGIPVPAVRVLLYLMETSQSWHIAERGTYASDQVEANWIHIGKDLQSLELVSNNKKNDAAIDRIIAGIMGESKGVNVVSIMQQTEQILRSNRMQYRNNGSYYYDATHDPFK